MLTEGPVLDERWPALSLLLWSVMMLLATAIALYAFRLLAVPSARPPFLLDSPLPLAVLLHFAGGGLALLLGPWQFFTARSRTRNIVHVVTGRLYVIAVLVGGIAALMLAPFSQGGLVAHVGFASLALLTLGTTARAYQLVRRGQIEDHRRWMIRGYSLIFAAVTLRLQIPASIIAGVPFESAYPVIAWTSWVPNILIAEWMLRRRDATTS